MRTRSMFMHRMPIAITFLMALFLPGILLAGKVPFEQYKFTVTIPDGWKQVQAPYDEGVIEMLMFTNDSGNKVITIAMVEAPRSETILDSGVVAEFERSIEQTAAVID